MVIKNRRLLRGLRYDVASAVQPVSRDSAGQDGCLGLPLGMEMAADVGAVVERGSGSALAGAGSSEAGRTGGRET